MRRSDLIHKRGSHPQLPLMHEPRTSSITQSPGCRSDALSQMFHGSPPLCPALCSSVKFVCYVTEDHIEVEPAGVQAHLQGRLTAEQKWQPAALSQWPGKPELPDLAQPSALTQMTAEFCYCCPARCLQQDEEHEVGTIIRQSDGAHMPTRDAFCTLLQRTTLHLSNRAS